MDRTDPATFATLIFLAWVLWPRPSEVVTWSGQFTEPGFEGPLLDPFSD
jgi:hypothetical protein